ncbi:hypothetical protein KEM48_009429 [Puccinia striiformis f. sp. tritici PST-130]|nr:hypothetical protein KEM48_009429 [Puccinia striiformis f. sp. tritici PST-130]
MSDHPSYQQNQPDHHPSHTITNYLSHQPHHQLYPINPPPARYELAQQLLPSSSCHVQQQHLDLPPAIKPPKKSGSRSAVACNLCRAQKMKCEGPSCQPCKRCQRLKQPCVFGESQGRGRQIVWAKRTEELESRVAQLEEELTLTKARVCRVETCVAHLQTTTKQQSRKRKPSIDSLPQDDPQPSQPARDSMVKGPKTSQAIQAAQFGPRRSDLIDRGMLSPHQAKSLFELHRKIWAPQIPWLNVPDTFDNVRWHSPLMLAVACSAGAKGCRDFDTYRKMKAHAIELILDVVFYRVFPHDRPQSYQDLIAVIGCIIHCGLYIDPVLVVGHAEYLGLRDVFDRIPEPRWQSEFDQRQLLSVARTFIGIYIHSVMYSTLIGRPCVMRISDTVLILYCNIICDSPYSDKKWDANLQYFVKYYVIMQQAQEELDSHNRLGSIAISDRLAKVEKYSALVFHWKQDLDRNGPELSPDAASEFKHLYHRAFAYLACFVTQDLREGNSLRENKQGLRLAKEGVAHALEVLKQFIDSRKAEPGVPCVHLEYRKSTISVATACILEGCVLIPEHIDFDNCRKIIKAFTDEVEAEGGEWGTGTEDKYVATLRLLLTDLDSRAIPQPPSEETNEDQSSLPSPLDITRSTSYPGPSAIERHGAVNDTDLCNSTPRVASQDDQANVPIRSETPPIAFLSYDQSMPSYSHEALERIQRTWYEDQKSYGSMDYEPSGPMIEQNPKVGSSDEEQPRTKMYGRSSCWKVGPSPISYENPSYPAQIRVDPEADEHRQQIFAHSDPLSAHSQSHPQQQYHLLHQEGTESGSSFTHSNSTTFVTNQSQSDSTQSFSIREPLALPQVPKKTFDLIESVRTVYPDRVVQTTYQRIS